MKAEEDMKKLDEALKGSLSGLYKTASNRSMAYTKLTLAEKELERLFPVFDKYSLVRHLIHIVLGICQVLEYFALSKAK